jgi:hypothetical protein
MFKNGKAAPFVDGKYATDIESEIEELDEEVAAGHPTFYIDDKEKELDTNVSDPMEAIRAKVIAEYLANQARAEDPTNDRGSTGATSEVATKGVLTTAGIKVGAINSNSNSK